jgi:hypothetical protein
MGLPNLLELHGLFLLELLYFRKLGEVVSVLLFFGLLFLAVFYFLMISLNIFLRYLFLLLADSFDSFKSRLLLMLLCILLLVVLAEDYLGSHLARGLGWKR